MNSSIPSTALQDRILFLENKLKALERKIMEEDNVRYAMVRYAKSYLMSADLPGDYCEFGVGEGKIFSYALRAFSHKYKQMNFWGYDTFTGMPNDGGIDANEFNPGYQKGQFGRSLEEVLSFCKQENPELDFTRVHLMPGLFSETLTENDRRTPKKIAVAFIDAIYYESIMEVLEFITDKVQKGTLLMFDDWHGMRNRPDLGSQKACGQWIEKTGINLLPCFPFGGIGQSFTVFHT